MFIERSSARIRTARTVFVLLGLFPCAALCGWAVLRHSVTHRDAIARRGERLLGLPVRIDRVEHVRPDALRLRGCTLSSTDGEDVLAVPVVDVESSPSEVHVRLERVACSPQLARMLTALAQQWLRQPSRFPLNCVVDVGEVSWSTGPETSDARTSQAAVARSAGVRIECVAANGSRAVRVTRGEPTGPAASVDEIRMVVSAGAGTGEAGEPSRVRAELTGAVASPLPVAILEACAGLAAGSLPFGGAAVVSGRFEASCEDASWSGTARARFERVELAEASRHLPHRMSGEATLVIDRVDWTRGQVDACDGQFSVVNGVVEQRLLDALVSAVGCRPGPAYRPVQGEQARGIDEAAGRLRIGPAGLDLRAATGRGTALALTRGAVILEEPPAAVPLERVAWAVSPPSAMPVPASKATGWLLGLFSDDILAGRAGGSGPSRMPSDQAGRPGRRSDF